MTKKPRLIGEKKKHLNLHEMKNASEKIKLECFPIFEDTTDKTSSNLNVFKYNMCILII